MTEAKEEEEEAAVVVAGATADAEELLEVKVISVVVVE